MHFEHRPPVGFQGADRIVEDELTRVGDVRKQLDAGERGLERADDGVVLGGVVIAAGAVVADDLALPG